MEIDEEIGSVNRALAGELESFPNEPIKKLMFYLNIIHNIIDFEFNDNYLNYSNPYFTNVEEMEDFFATVKYFSPYFFLKKNILSVSTKTKCFKIVDKDENNLISDESDGNADVSPQTNNNISNNINNNNTNTHKHNHNHNHHHRITAPLNELYEESYEAQNDAQKNYRKNCFMYKGVEVHVKYNLIFSESFMYEFFNNPLEKVGQLAITEPCKDNIVFYRNVYFYLIIICLIILFSFSLVLLNKSLDLKGNYDFQMLNGTETFKRGVWGSNLGAASGSFGMIFIVFIVSFYISVRKEEKKKGGLTCCPIIIFIVTCLCIVIVSIVAEGVISWAFIYEMSIIHETMKSNLTMNTGMIVDYILIVVFYYKK